jgi:hypothetical protein
MIVKEFIRRRIAPLQDHWRKMWAYTGRDDLMWLHPLGLDKASIAEAMKRLIADEDVPDLTGEFRPLYCLKEEERDSILEVMPHFDQWGLRPEGLEGERENPLVPVPEEETEESEAAVMDEAESLRPRRLGRVLVVSSDDEGATEKFVAAPSPREDDEGEARDEPREEGGSEGPEDAAGVGGSSSVVAASPPAGVKRRHWAAADE